MIGKRFRSLPFIFANDNYTLRLSKENEGREYKKIVTKTQNKHSGLLCTFILDSDIIAEEKKGGKMYLFNCMDTYMHTRQ